MIEAIKNLLTGEHDERAILTRQLFDARRTRAVHQAAAEEQAAWAELMSVRILRIEHELRSLPVGETVDA